ncbi:MAG: hypothetical protein KDA89_16170 [Planctomycetaceae bacterium]|nr:hypothetical protein [Planctomycetaceae bacterium]
MHGQKAVVTVRRCPKTISPDKYFALMTDVDEQVVAAMERDSDSLWHNEPILAAATLVGPVLITGALLTSIAAASGWETAHRLMLAAVMTFFALGRFVILGGSSDSSVASFTAGELAVMVLYMDIMTAIIVSWHAGVLFRLPWLGERVRFLIESGRTVLEENRWMRRMTFFAIVAFVMFPHASSGSVGGSLFGRLLGLSRLTTFVGVVVGSVCGCGTMYYGATVINRWISPDNTALRWGGIIAVVLLLAILNGRYRKLQQ